MTERILALDVGDRRIGVAVSDLLGITAQPVETIFTKGIDNDIARVAELAREYGVTRVVLGDPRLLSGERGLQAAKVDAFRARLEQSGFEIRTQDERLTSVSAERVLISAGVRRDERKKVVDKLAATYILQAFLDSGGWREIAPARAHFNENGVYRLMEGYMESDNIVELVDEDGMEAKFNHVMTLEYENESYVLLSPAEPMDDMEDDEIVILRIDKDENGIDMYVSVDDDDVLENVFNKYLSIAEEDEDTEADEAEDDEGDAE